MDFELTDDQKLILDNVATFVKKDSPIDRFRKQRDQEPGWSKAVWKQMGELGWLGLPFSEEVGGMGMSFLEIALLLERFGTTLVPEPIIPSVVLGGSALAKAGTKAQQEKWLAPMIAGDTTLSLAFVEEKSRHDVSHVETRAEPAAGGYVLNGKKLWALNADAADQIIVSARTHGAHGDAEGISLFVVDRGAEGVKLSVQKTIDGRRAAHVELLGVKVGKDALLGKEGQALPLLEELVDLGAAAACAEGGGVLETVMEMTREYLCDREQFGVKIGTFQALQHRAVDMFVEVQLAKSTTLLAALKVDAPVHERQRAISVAKTQLAQSGHFVTRQGIQLHGGIGVTDEHNVGLYFKRMNVLAALFGDEEHHVQRFASLPTFQGAQ
jgi:alkylation response protein AidB-like acyl-CoA dehydrogenase